MNLRLGLELLLEDGCTSLALGLYHHNLFGFLFVLHNDPFGGEICMLSCLFKEGIYRNRNLNGGSRLNVVGKELYSIFFPKIKIRLELYLII